MTKHFIVISILVIFCLIGCKKNPVSPPVNNLPDTTSHNFSWQIDTIGIYPSQIDGVWGTDINNVYAVGLIFYSYSPYTFTGIIHWDGTKGTSMDYHEGCLQGIYGFGANDIWAVGYWQVDYNMYALITHWDGKIWTTWKLQQYGALCAIWGTNSNNLYATGAGDYVLHYDGTDWTKQPSSTTFGLSDIYGIDNNNIFAAGWKSSSGSGVLTKYDGTSWKTVTNGGNIDSVTLYGIFESTWSFSVNKLYLVGSLCYEGTPGNWKLSDIPNNSPENNFYGLAAMNYVRGNAANNVFIVGDRDLIIHWNGKSWNIYKQYFDKTKQSSLKGIWMKDKSVFFVGYENGLSQAVVYRGTQ
jgi:hypothetical protein